MRHVKTIAVTVMAVLLAVAFSSSTVFAGVCAASWEGNSGNGLGSAAAGTKLGGVLVVEYYNLSYDPFSGAYIADVRIVLRLSRGNDLNGISQETFTAELEDFDTSLIGYDPEAVQGIFEDAIAGYSGGTPVTLKERVLGAFFGTTSAGMTITLLSVDLQEAVFEDEYGLTASVIVFGDIWIAAD